MRLTVAVLTEPPRLLSGSRGGPPEHRVVEYMSGVKHRSIMTGQPPTNSTSSSQLPRPLITLISPLEGTSAQSVKPLDTTINISLSLSTPTLAPPMPHDKTSFPFQISSMIGRPKHALPNLRTHSHTQGWSQQSNPVYPQPATPADAFITDLITPVPHSRHPRRAPIPTC